MLTGHYASAFAGKATDRRVPLWALFIAAQLIDVIHMILLLLGIERSRLDFTLPSNPLVIEYLPYTHSLIATLAWAALAFAVTWRWLRSVRAGLVMAAVVTSHWVLDFLVHRPDLTLAGGEHKLGLGLWNYPVLGLVVELATLAAGVIAYFAVAKPAPRERTAALVVVAVLAAVQAYAFFGPPPPTITMLATSALALFAGAALLARRAK